jgi:hypothetical protein
MEYFDLVEVWNSCILSAVHYMMIQINLTQNVQVKVEQTGKGQDSDLATGDHNRFSSGAARSRWKLGSECL